MIFLSKKRVGGYTDRTRVREGGRERDHDEGLL